MCKYNIISTYIALNKRQCQDTHKHTKLFELILQTGKYLYFSIFQGWYLLCLSLHWVQKNYHLQIKMASVIFIWQNLIELNFRVEEAWNGGALRMSTWVGKHMLLLSRGCGTPEFLHKCEVFINVITWGLF